MSIETVLKSIHDQADTIEKLEKEFTKALSASFKDMFVEARTIYPELKSISWVQYTPYFNDGDPCTFSIWNPLFLNFVPTSGQQLYEADYLLEGDRVSDQEYLDNGMEPWYRAINTKKDNIDFRGEFEKILNLRPEVLNLLFGDGLINITENGVEVLEYPHD